MTISDVLTALAEFAPLLAVVLAVVVGLLLVGFVVDSFTSIREHALPSRDEEPRDVL